MTAAEFEAWEEANVMLFANQAASPCADCTAAFAEEMRAEGRCDGEPREEPERKPGMSSYHEGLRRERWSRIERAASLLEEGLSHADIARHMGVTRGCVTHWLITAREGAA